MKLINDEIERARRESKALYEQAERDGLAVLEETRKKCDAMIDEAGRTAVAAVRRKSNILLTIFAVSMAMTFSAGYLVGRIHWW
jgi:hypothetical protein